MTTDDLVCNLVFIPKLVDAYAVKLFSDPQLEHRPEWKAQRFCGLGVLKDFTTSGNAIIRNPATGVQNPPVYALFDQREVYMLDITGQHFFDNWTTTQVTGSELEALPFTWLKKGATALGVSCGVQPMFHDPVGTYLPGVQERQLCPGVVVFNTLHALRS